MKIVIKKYKNILLGIGIVTLVGGSSELFCRYILGLGTPPLSITHPKIEYMFKPNQNVLRFGNRFITNSYGMRSEQFSQTKKNNELRILVFGDSVVNGGNLTDQSDLATEIVHQKLTELRFNSYQKITVGNVSAGSWGPGNWLAYVKEYGFFDADIIILLISSHDYADNPTFAPLNPNTHPTQNPPLATIEALQRYLPRYLPQFSLENKPDEKNLSPPAVAIEKGLADLKEFLGLARIQSKHVIVIQHLTKEEITGKKQPGFTANKSVCLSLRLKCLSLETVFRKSMTIGQDPYRDDIHINALGQLIVANVIVESIKPQLTLSM